MAFKDHYSQQAEAYARYRPTYPPELYAYLASLCTNRAFALDCATGNGQAAVGLAEHFDHVLAIDASESQLKQARVHSRIEYKAMRAEKTGLPDSSVDLITAACGVHWFDLEAFFKEAQRILKPDGIISVWCFDEPEDKNPVEVLIRQFEREILKEFVPMEVKQWVWSHYETLPFPFQEIHAPSFELKAEWDFKGCLGYLASWSSTQRFLNANGINPVKELEPSLQKAFKEVGGVLRRRCPIYMRVGRKG